MNHLRKPESVDRKPDLYEGKSEIPEILKNRKKLEKSQIPFRVNASTVILVDPKKANEAYRQECIKKYNLTNTKRL